jgi:hypothetical protein
VFVGLETKNEMCVGFLGVTGDKPGRIRFDVEVKIQGLSWLPAWNLPIFGI